VSAIAETAGSVQTDTTPNAPASNTVSAQVGTTPNAAKVLGTLELRPSYGSKVGEYHTENNAAVGYQFSKTESLIYKQEFNTNLFDPNSSASAGGVNLIAKDGYFRGRINDISRIFDAGPLFSYEARVYLPTDAVKRDAGQLVSIRNYAKLKQSVSDRVALFVEETPILHVYNTAGSVNAKGAAANPWFENRFTLGAEANLGKGFKLVVPVYFSNCRHRDFVAKAKNNNAWAHKLWLYPELLYTVNANTSLGLGYYSENLVTSDLSTTAINEGLEKGVTQLILSVAL